MQVGRAARTLGPALVGVLLVAGSQGQDPARSSGAVALRVRCDLEIAQWEPGATTWWQATTRVDHRLLLLGRRVQDLQIDREVRRSTRDARLERATTLTGEQLTRWVGERLETVSREAAPAALRTRMAPLGRPCLRLTTDRSGHTEERRELLGAPPPQDAVELATALLLPAPAALDDRQRLIHLPVGDLTFRGTLRTGTVAPGEDGRPGVSVTAELLDRVPVGGGAVLEHTVTLRGRLTWDPRSLAWVAGELRGPLRIIRSDTGEEVGDGHLQVTLQPRSSTPPRTATARLGGALVSFRHPDQWSDRSDADRRPIALRPTPNSECSVTIVEDDAPSQADALRRWAEVVGCEPPAEPRLQRLAMLGEAASLAILRGPERTTLGVFCSLDGRVVLAALTAPNAEIGRLHSDFEDFCASLAFVDDAATSAQARVKQQTVSAIDALLQALHMARTGGDPAQARRYAQQLVEQHGATPDRLALLAVTYAQSGDLDNALATCDRAIELDAQASAPWTARSYVHELRGDAARAAADRSRADSSRPETATAWIAHADFLVILNRFRDAISAYDRALDISPGDFLALTRRGEARAFVSDLPGARDDYRAAWRANPGAVDAELSWRVIDVRLSPGTATLRPLAELALRHPETQQASACADHAWLLGDYQLAAKLFGLRADSPMASPATLAELMQAYLDAAASDRDAALAHCSHAAAVAPASLQIWVAFMRWYITVQEDLTTADRELRAAAAGAPNGDEIAVAASLAACLGTLDDLERLRGTDQGRSPPLFYAATRAMARGEPRRAAELLRRCVDTGEVHWAQWKMAAHTLRESLPADAWRSDAGLQLSFGAGGGAEIRAVRHASAAWQKDLRPGDVIVALYARPLTAASWEEATRDAPVGKGLPLLIRRDVEYFSVDLMLGLAPAN